MSEVVDYDMYFETERVILGVFKSKPIQIKAAKRSKKNQKSHKTE